MSEIYLCGRCRAIIMTPRGEEARLAIVQERDKGKEETEYVYVPICEACIGGWNPSEKKIKEMQGRLDELVKKTADFVKNQTEDNPATRTDNREKKKIKLL